MHELALTEELLRLVEESAEGRPVQSVQVEIGALSAVVPEAFESCFALLTDARLEIIRQPGLALCRSCVANVPLDSPLQGCPQCHGHDLKWLQGQHVRLIRLEVD